MKKRYDELLERKSLIAIIALAEPQSWNFQGYQSTMEFGLGILAGELAQRD